MKSRIDTISGAISICCTAGRFCRRAGRALFPFFCALAALIAPVVPVFAQAAPAPGVAQPAPPGSSESASPPVDPDAVTPPKLLAYVEAGYPDAARAQKLDAAVLLKITIGEDGFVEDVALAGVPAGHGFDELAIAAARRFVFEPAAKGGVPMRARVQYLYEFKYQEPVAAKGTDVQQAASSAPEQEARVTLTLRSAEKDEPLANVEVMLTSPTDTSFARRLVTDDKGLAHAEGIPPGSYDMAVEADGFAEQTHREELPAGETTDLTYRLHSSTTDYEEYGAVAVIKAPAREVTRRTIEREVLTRVAGTRGDALRAIELLPGVARPPFTAGLVLIRGGSPSDSQAFLDGVPVPLLYHFGGLTSFINSRALDRIDFYPGNFSARYGRVTAGIVDVAVRDPRTDGYHGVIDLNVPLDSSLLLEGPITDKASFMVGGRRSYFGEIVKAVVPADAVGALAAPVYYDYQAFVTYRPTDRDRLRVGAYGSSDRLDILFAEDDDDPAIEAAEVTTQFNRAQLGWKHQYAANTEHDIQLSVGKENTVFKFPPAFNLNLDSTRFYLRGELRHRVTSAVQLIAGTDNDISLTDAYYYGPAPQDEANSGSGADFAQQPNQIYDSKATSAAVSGYLELALTPTRKLRIVPGLRLDYFNLLSRFGFDPRLSASYAITDKTRVRAGLGVFSQPATPPFSLPGLGNPELLFTKAIHYGVGVDHNFTKEFTLVVDGFYKSIYDRVVGTDFAAAAMRGQLDPPPFDNDGIGRVYGLEVLGRKQASGRWFGFLSYTLMRSELKDHDQPWRASNYDQRHILSVAGNVRLARNWEVGGVLRVVTGNPRTPVVGASFDQDTGSYNPENGRLNSARQPTFNRIDLRAEKSYIFKSWRLAVYLDIQNTYNARYPETVTYNFNYKQQATVKGLPILPVLGVRGTL